MLGHCREPLTEDHIFFSTETLMDLLESQSGIFQKKVYRSEKCAESALKSVLGDLSHTYFVGNAPMGHMEQTLENIKSQVIAMNKLNIGKCEDYVWVTKDELMEYFPEKAEFLNKMIIT